MNDFGIRWQEINKNYEIVTKQKFFKTEAARIKFVDKLIEKNSFYQILAYTENFA